MGRAKTTPTLGGTVNTLLARVGRLERVSRETLSPAALSAAVTVASTAPTPTHAALVNPVGSSITWWVRVAPAAGATVSLLLRDETTGVEGPSTSTGTADVVKVRYPLGADWDTGDLHSVLLVAWVTTGSTTVLPVRAGCT